ncbi:ParB N-terminal domain-containing protein [uncultured Cohaesibacter sp.]|uniref:ParB N-terminal domain-containing protein n=1 Tax=uncultured Cohaesibacter sp. TaxID=1002546 RepID=UPI0029C96600|nr:ParB N-terminal domain-containing protein [uncultured Cohaesibacter sp.]
MTHRELSASDFEKATPAENFGPAPMMDWIPIKLLVIDETYQRSITAKGKHNIVKIIENFCWSKFSAVLVAPIEGGLYSVIDGQHRATAVLACGIEKVPCQIIQADRREQADAFAAVNNVRTNMQPITLYNARVTSGDPKALRVADVCARAGVEIPRSVQSSLLLKPNQFQSPSTTERLIEQYGEEVIITTLKALVEVAPENVSLLSVTNFKALSAVLWANKAWRDAGGALFDVLDDVDFDGIADKARELRKMTPGTSIASNATVLLEKKMKQLFEQLEAA